MRYQRIEECSECEGVGAPWCPHCLGAGEIRTVVEHTGMWALMYQGIPTRLGTDENAIWSQVVNDGLDVKVLKAAGYTCKQIDVIRRDHD